MSQPGSDYKIFKKCIEKHLHNLPEKKTFRFFFVVLYLTSHACDTMLELFQKFYRFCQFPFFKTKPVIFGSQLNHLAELHFFQYR